MTDHGKCKRRLVVLLRVAACLTALFAPATPAVAATYHVAPDGDDADPGTASRPWRTIQRAADAVGPGDTVLVRGGTYREAVTITRSGSPGAPITFAAAPGPRPVIDAAGLALSDYFGAGIGVRGARHVRIDGFVVQNVTGGFGILCFHARDCTVENSRTYNTLLSGIAVWSTTQALVRNNEVELANNDGEQEAITVTRSAFVEVLGNHVHHGGPGTRGGEGIDVKDGSHDVLVKGNYVHHMNRLCLYVDAWRSPTWNIVLDGNRVHDCYRHGIAVASERGGPLTGVRIVNNVVHGNVRTGIVIADWDAGYRHPIRDVAIVNNTIVGNGDAGAGGGILVAERRAERIVIRNNVISGNGSFTIMAPRARPGTLTVERNLIDGFRGRTGEVRGTEWIEGDPLFVDAGAADFRLRPASPAIGQGAPAGAPPHDADDRPRPAGGQWDLGAYEFIAGPEAPVARLGARPVRGPAPLTVAFRDYTIGLPDAWTWTFGDGGPGAAVRHPVHTYGAPGRYTVSLRATNALGDDTTTRTGFVTVTPPADPVVVFAEGFESGLAGWVASGLADRHGGRPRNGSASARLRGASALETEVSTAGYRYVSLELVAATRGLDDAGERLVVEWHDGTAWVTALDIPAGHAASDGRFLPFVLPLPGGADDRAALGLRVVLHADSRGDQAFVDDITVRGFPE